MSTFDFMKRFSMFATLASASGGSALSRWIQLRAYESIQMKRAFQSSRDVILQTDNWAKAIEFYETTLGFPVSHRSPDLIGFETGAFCLYVEKGSRPGPVFDFLVPSMKATKSRLLAAGCTIVEEDPAVPRCYIQDPFGLVFNIEQTAE
jgi:predicted enzyme related to lactoylglutathione lyase